MKSPESTAGRGKEQIQLYDFYYSAKANEMSDEQAHLGETDDLGPVWAYRSSIHGKPFTEMVKKGEKPIGNFDDYELVYSGGKKEDVEHKER